VKILIDTQIFLWLFGFVSRISPDIENLLKSGNPNLYFSAASVWEIAIKYGNGKLHLPDKPEIFVPDRMSRTLLSSDSIFAQYSVKFIDSKTYKI
jgi:PIN domain nuclease of toxin-antitoxin system